jgi:hypothetical protein
MAGASRDNKTEAAPFLPIRTVVIILAALSVGTVVGLITWLSSGSLWGAVLAGLTAGGAAMVVLERWVK